MVVHGKDDKGVWATHKVNSPENQSQLSYKNNDRAVLAKLSGYQKICQMNQIFT